MAPGTVLIFTNSDTPRLRYIAGILLGDTLGLRWDVVCDRRRLGKHPVINYSTEKVAGSFRIEPSGLLTEKGISAINILVSDWKGLPVFFRSDGEPDFPFDIFSAAFYLITRYEEYLPHDADAYGRFRASSSLAFRNGFLDKPVVDLWAWEFAKGLLRKFQSLTFRRNEFRSLLTVNIGQPSASRGRNFMGSVSGFFHNLASAAVHSDHHQGTGNGEKDPFRVFKYIFDKIDSTGTDCKFFLPMGDNSRFDRNPSWKNDDFRKTILKISDRYDVCLQLSYDAADSSTETSREQKRLMSVLSRGVERGRVHHLKSLLPGPYANIERSGLKEDYSMGYPDQPGFRAGTARSFYLYNLQEERQSGLKIVPFQFRDTSSEAEKTIDPATARTMIRKLLDATRKAGGTFVSVWYTESLIENEKCRAWRDVFEYLLEIQAK